MLPAFNSKGTDLAFECGGEVIAWYTLQQERYLDIPKNQLE